MLYDEFLAGTKARDNEHNHEVYKRVEKIYMCDESMTKEDAYNIAQLWIDNSLTPDQIACNEQTQKQINALHDDIEYWQVSIKATKETIKEKREELKRYKEYIANDKQQIELLEYSIIK